MDITTEHRIHQPSDRNPHPTALELPSAPPRMTPPPPRELLTDDGTMSVPAFSPKTGAPNGWKVFDATGMCRTLLIFADCRPRTSLDFKALGIFEYERRAVGDPLFAQTSFFECHRAATLAPDGPLTCVRRDYTPILCDEHKRALIGPDGTYSVEVSCHGDSLALLVLDSMGDVVDGCTAWNVDEDEPSEEMEQRAIEFVQRRLQAGDPLAELGYADEADAERAWEDGR